jgi:hypothetical protein
MSKRTSPGWNSVDARTELPRTTSSKCDDNSTFKLSIWLRICRNCCFTVFIWWRVRIALVGCSLNRKSFPLTHGASRENGGSIPKGQRGQCTSNRIWVSNRLLLPIWPFVLGQTDKQTNSWTNRQANGQANSSLVSCMLWLGLVVAVWGAGALLPLRYNTRL